MVSLKTLLKPHLLYTFFRTPKPPIYTQFHNSQRNLFTNTQFNLSSDIKESLSQFKTNPNGKMKSLDIIFKEAVGLIEEKLEDDCEIELEENNELQKKLKKIEIEVRNMKGNMKEKTSKKSKKTMNLEKKPIESVKPKVNSLFSVFTDDPKRLDLKKCDEILKEEKGGSKVKGEVVLNEMKEFSPEMKLFVRCLHEKGYFKGANFLRSEELDFGRFSTDYSRGYLRNAAVRFCRDHPEIVNCLSESDVKRLALFGCPSDAKKLVFVAKGLRSHFSIQEDMVCRPCVLNNSCKFKYSYVGKKYDELDFANVMKILISYALESGPPQLVLSEEMKDSVRNLLRQIVEQSQ